VTRWDRVTQIRDSWASSRLFGPQWAATASRDLAAGDKRQSSQIPRYVGQNDQGPPVGAGGPCWNRDGLCNPTEWRRRESNEETICRNECSGNSLREQPKALGASGECLPSSRCQCSALAGTSLESSPPAIRHIANAWPNLPPHIREAILTLIDAASSRLDEGGHAD
jgi:hypothetical protein